jgi:hypothetical protein
MGNKHTKRKQDRRDHKEPGANIGVRYFGDKHWIRRGDLVLYRERFYLVKSLRNDRDLTLSLFNYERLYNKAHQVLMIQDRLDVLLVRPCLLEMSWEELGKELASDLSILEAMLTNLSKQHQHIELRWHRDHAIAEGLKQALAEGEGVI